jgi:hypothetical protein
MGRDAPLGVASRNGTPNIKHAKDAMRTGTQRYSVGIDISMPIWLPV